MKTKIKYEIRTINVNEILFDPKNPNKLSPSTEKSLKNSLNKFGYVQPIILDKNTMMVADGEHRLKELINQGVTEVEVFLFPFKDESERRMFRQAANKIHGTHDELLDLEEFKYFLDNNSFDEFKELIDLSDKEAKKFISKIDKVEDLSQELDKIYHHEIVCPNCGHKFKKKQQE